MLNLTANQKDAQKQYAKNVSGIDSTKLNNRAETENILGSNSFVFKKGKDPNTGKYLTLSTRSEWCAYYDYLTKVLHGNHRGMNHENATTGGHANQSCWKWIPVELGGIGNIHVRISQDNKFFELYSEDYPKTIMKIKVAKGVLNSSL